MLLAAPRSHAAAQHRDVTDAGTGEQRRGLRGALVGQTDDHYRAGFPIDCRDIAQQFRKRHIARAVDMTERPVELVRAAHVEDQRMLTAAEPAAQVARLDSGSAGLPAAE